MKIGQRADIHVSLKCQPAGIHVDIRSLSDFHLFQLRLFEIGRDPNIIQWD